MTHDGDFLTFPGGLHHAFSPTGQALAFLAIKDLRAHAEILFADRREPHKLDLSDVNAIVWASETEVAFVRYHTVEPSRAISVYSVDSRSVQDLAFGTLAGSIAESHLPGRLSLLGVSDGIAGLFEIDTRRHSVAAVTGFKGALEHLRTFPNAGHTWFPDRSALFLKARLLSRSPGKMVSADNDEAPCPPAGLVRVNADGAIQIVTGTEGAFHPLVSPDTKTLAFSWLVGSTIEIWAKTLPEGPERFLGTQFITSSAVMRPEGALFAHFIDATIPDFHLRKRSAQWHSVSLCPGDTEQEVSPRRLFSVRMS